MLTLVAADAPVLRQVATPIRRVTGVHRRTGAEMLAFLRGHATGVGLAAPQVGIPKRMFALHYQGSSAVFVNPVLSEFSEETAVAEESCLSLPGVTVPVLRSTSVRMTGILRSEAPVDLMLTGSVARIVQHEVDHLDGILITDREYCDG